MNRNFIPGFREDIQNIHQPVSDLSLSGTWIKDKQHFSHYSHLIIIVYALNALGSEYVSLISSGVTQR